MVMREGCPSLRIQVLGHAGVSHRIALRPRKAELGMRKPGLERSEMRLVKEVGAKIGSA